MASLLQKLKSYGENYWDFSEYREKDSFIRYPATMVAPMQEKIINDILECDKNISNIMDPFVGSGTTLSIGYKLGLDVYGIDINPLATLITRVKLEGVPKNKMNQSISQLRTFITLYLGNVPRYSFTNINKWFRDDVIMDLSLLRFVIQLEKNIRIRRFFWVCFAETVRKYCNSRSSTFKLHVKESDKILKMENNCIEFFMDLATCAWEKFDNNSSFNSINLLTGDSIEELKKIKDNSIDLICTSPPYGDNHTTVTYGQYSILPLLWINNVDLDPFDNDLFSNFSIIDTKSLGGRSILPMNYDIYKDLICELSKEKKKKVVNFFDDYCRVFEQMARLIKPYKRIVLTLGNRRVDNKEIPFNTLNDRLADRYGLQKEAIITRNIHGKRMPIKVSNLPRHGSVSSMTKEYVIIYKKR